MAEINGEILHSEQLRDAIFSWIPEAVRVHNVRFSGHFWLDGDDGTEFHIMYDPDGPLLDLDVFERKSTGFLMQEVELDANTGEVQVYGITLVGLDKKPERLSADSEEFAKFLGSIGLNFTILTGESENYFLRILSGSEE